MENLEGEKLDLCIVHFSSAYNCMQPIILDRRLFQTSGIDFGIIRWLVGSLRMRSQRSRVNTAKSEALMYRITRGALCSLYYLYHVISVFLCQGS